MLNPKPQTQNSKSHDLRDRTLRFARMVRDYVKNLPNTPSNTDDAIQLIKASGSVGANYIEAEEALSRKDFVMRIKMSRKEAKESGYWLELTESKEEQIKEKQKLIREATELTKIFESIVEKSK
jgi:four helix bundle protein